VTRSTSSTSSSRRPPPAFWRPLAPAAVRHRLPPIPHSPARLDRAPGTLLGPPRRRCDPPAAISLGGEGPTLRARGPLPFIQRREHPRGHGKAAPAVTWAGGGRWAWRQRAEGGRRKEMHETSTEVRVSRGQPVLGKNALGLRSEENRVACGRSGCFPAEGRSCLQRASRCARLSSSRLYLVRRIRCPFLRGFAHSLACSVAIGMDRCASPSSCGQRGSGRARTPDASWMLVCIRWPLSCFVLSLLTSVE